MKKNIYSVAVILSGILWGLMGFFRRRLGDMGLDTAGVIFVRCGIAALLFALTIVLTDPSAIKIKLRDIWLFVGSGICSLLFFTLCYFQAMTLMSLSTAAILLYTAPCFVIIMSAVIFKERVDGRKLCAMALAFAGCCLVSGIGGGEGRLSLSGLLFGLGSGFGYALYSIFGKLAMERGYKSNTVNLYSCLLAALGAMLICGVSKPVEIMLSSSENFLFCLLSAFVTCYLPYLLYTYGLSGIEAGKASIMASVEPVVATLVGLLAFGEKITAWSAAGIVLVLFAIVLLNVKKRERGNT